MNQTNAKRRLMEIKRRIALAKNNQFTAKKNISTSKKISTEITNFFANRFPRIQQQCSTQMKVGALDKWEKSP